MGKKVKKHSSEFKFKVVLESYIKDNVAEVSRQYGINANQLFLWRKQFISQGHQAFEGDAAKGDAKFRKKIEQLENLIGKSRDSMTVATSWCTRDCQDRRSSPVYSLHAFGSTGLLACH
jgi:transposase-like protein